MNRTAKRGAPVRTVMGRRVIHRSPDKHPEQTDAQVSAYDQMLADIDTSAAAPGNVSQMRKTLKKAQEPSSDSARKLNDALDYVNRVLGGGRSK